MGTITLDVIFGTPDNFQRESIDFEVVDWKSHVTYLHLKIGKVPVYSANPWIVSFAHTV
jgi:hypothetical protein